jgi:NAD(P)-dependent dehydrogenase (short-subunit alcohol dehydrogenase family)
VAAEPGEGALEGQVAVVTGGASGIGAATARRLARAGADVAVLDRDAERGGQVAGEVRALGRRALFLELDLSRPEGVPAAVESVVASLGRIDVLVNCAGITGHPAPGKVLELAEETWDVVFAVNAKAPFLLMQEVGRRMVEAGRGGRIVNVTSSSAHRALSMPAYSASKAALGQLTRAAAAELGPHGINVNNVAPGLTRTPIATDVHAEETMERKVREGPLANLLHRVSEPDDVAGTILFLCLPDSRQITAQTIHTSAGAVV